MLQAREKATAPGLHSLDATLKKLDADGSRHGQVLRKMAKAMAFTPMSPRMAHRSRRFKESGYTIKRTIGEGRWGSVKLAKKNDSYHASVKGASKLDLQDRDSIGDNFRQQTDWSPYVAIRMIPRYRIREARLVKNDVRSNSAQHAALLTQIRALHELDHPNICRESETFEDAQCIYIVMELYTGVSLLDFRHKVGPLGAPEFAKILGQLLAAMAHAHSKGVVHQDLRLENVRFATVSTSSRIVVTDWSCADFIDAPSCKRPRRLAKSEFAAPELATSQTCSDRADIWSIGVMSFVLLTFNGPIKSSDDVLKKGISWGKTPQQIPKSCKELVEVMLRTRPKERPPAGELLASSFLKQTWPSEEPHDALVHDVAGAFVNFQKKTRLQKMAATYAAAHLTGVELQELVVLFSSMDKNQDGTIDGKEMEATLKRYLGHRITEDMELSTLVGDPSQISAVFAGLDTDVSGRVSYTEFLAAATDMHMQHNIDLCWEAFREFEVEGSGLISVHDIERFLCSQRVEELFESVRRSGNEEGLQKALDMLGGKTPLAGRYSVRSLDKDQDGFLSFDEFLQMVLDWRDPNTPVSDVDVKQLKKQGAHVPNLMHKTIPLHLLGNQFF